MSDQAIKQRKLDILKLAGQVAKLKDMNPTHSLSYCAGTGKVLDNPQLVEVKYVVDDLAGDTKVIYKDKWGAGVLPKELFEKHAQPIGEVNHEQIMKDRSRICELNFEQDGQGELIII